MEQRVVICYSGVQLGYPLADALAAALAVRLGVPQEQVGLFNVDMPESVAAQVVSDGGVLIVWDALEWYLKHRHVFQGRPWVVALLTSGHAVAQLTRVTTPFYDLGIAALFSSSAHCVERLHVSANPCFVKPPLPVIPVEQAPARYGFGCVLPNLVDRDLSALAWAARMIPDETYQLRIVVNTHAVGRLPDELVPYVTRVAPEQLASSWMTFQCALPAFRLTDYRFGLVPAELAIAEAAGTPTIVPAHQHLEQVNTPLVHKVSSLELFKEAIMSSVSSDASAPAAGYAAAGSTPDELAAQLVGAYQEWQAHAAARV